jgi:hypothetical protein
MHAKNHEDYIFKDTGFDYELPDDDKRKPNNLGPMKFLKRRRRRRGHARRR